MGMHRMFLDRWEEKMLSTNDMYVNSEKIKFFR